MSIEQSVRSSGEFRLKHGCDPTPEELEVLIKKASEEDPKIKALDAKEIHKLGIMLYPLVYLDQANSEDENLTRLDYLSSEVEFQPENKTELTLNQEYVNILLGGLVEEDRTFILLKFGFIDGKERDHKEMAASFRKQKMTEQEAKKKFEQIMSKLKQFADKEKTNLD